MVASLVEGVLDAILAVQLTVAWAGEGRCAPKRLGWWDTDLIDPAGGGDFFARLMPRTHAWAALEATHEAARRTDAKARSKMAEPDKMRTIYFLGFEVDERLSDRLRALKVAGRPPAEVLPLRIPLTADFDRAKLEAVIGGGDAQFTVVPGGRQLRGKRPDALDAVVARLAAALVPLADAYPLPFYKLEA